VAKPKADVARELDELYHLPLSEFTAARNELAKRLKTDGRGEEAEEVRALRKPTVPVWLVNRLAHERELDVQRLRKAGEALAKGQAAATAGKSSDAFVEARQEEQRALTRLSEAAGEIAAREGLGAAATDRALETLRAASLSEEGRELLKRGRLTEELEPPGFEALAGLVGSAPPRTEAPAKKDDGSEQRQALKEARERVKELKAEERELEAAARDAARDAARAEKEAAALRSRASDAETDAADAAERRAEAEAEVERLTP
jgi:hypothetical protein